ncbi:MAG TPA: diguanylate cyclase, partial [Methylophaga sp.]|nr:diguanylate cyclase [Methylophaga sp.]
IGIAFFPEHGSTLDNLVKVADRAMYVVKRQGKNNYSFAEYD